MFCQWESTTMVQVSSLGRVLEQHNISLSYSDDSFLFLIWSCATNYIRLHILLLLKKTIVKSIEQMITQANKKWIDFTFAVKDPILLYLQAYRQHTVIRRVSQKLVKCFFPIQSHETRQTSGLWAWLTTFFENPPYCSRLLTTSLLWLKFSRSEFWVLFLPNRCEQTILERKIKKTRRFSRRMTHKSCYQKTISRC